MWRKYAEIFFRLMQEHFFVGFEEMDVSEEDQRTLVCQVAAHNNAEKMPKLPRTIGIQLMCNIAEEILHEMTLKMETIEKYAPEKKDDFFIGEFERLSVVERHFLILWIYQGFAVSDSFRYRIGRGAFEGYHLIQLLPPKSQ